MTTPTDLSAVTVQNLAKELVLSPGQTVSQTLYQDEHVKVLLFGFAAGQELSEHTASVPAMLSFVSGQATVTLGDDTVQAEAGTFTHMPAHLPHSIVAQTDTRMLLIMLKGARAE